MLEKFKYHLQENFGFLKNQKLLLAVSGGIDSMVLLHLFEQLDFDFGVLHCNFNLRELESAGDENFLIQYSKKSKNPFFFGHFNTKSYAEKHKLSIQLAARQIRYEWFNEQLNEHLYDFVLTAHHLDDCLETFFINLGRGTGLEGLKGIPNRNQKIIRPMLPFSRTEIESYSKSNKIEWREDSSNESDKYLRNKIRHHVVSATKQAIPNFLKGFEKTQKNLQDDNKLVLDAVAFAFEKVATQNGHFTIYNLDVLTTLNNYKIYIFHWFKDYDFKSFEDIYDLVTAENGKFIENVNYRILKNRNELIFSRKEFFDEKPVFIIDKVLKNPKIPIKLSFCKVTDISVVDNMTIFVDQDRIAFPLELRKPFQGENFFPKGLNGSKVIIKHLKDEKLTFIEKQHTWVLLDHKKTIIWVVGIRQDQRCMVNPQTKNILRIDLKK
jgi:tRNA(Ile)-lysidine synthetase-like protein